MPGRTQYPSGDDLQAYLVGAGFSATFLATQGYDLELFAVAGWQAFNREANRVMLARTQTREFSAERVSPRGFLDLGADLVAVTSVVYGTTTFTEGTDFRLMPLNAAEDGRPYQGLSFGTWRRFYSSTFPLTMLISIAGSWGFGLTIPEDAWLGMLALAAMEMGPALAQARSGGLEMWSEADMTERYGSDPLAGVQKGWRMTAQRTAGALDEKGSYRYGRYTRVPM